VGRQYNGRTGQRAWAEWTQLEGLASGPGPCKSCAVFDQLSSPSRHEPKLEDWPARPGPKAVGTIGPGRGRPSVNSPAGASMAESCGQRTSPGRNAGSSVVHSPRLVLAQSPSSRNTESREKVAPHLNGPKAGRPPGSRAAGRQTQLSAKASRGPQKADDRIVKRRAANLDENSVHGKCTTHFLFRVNATSKGVRAKIHGSSSRFSLPARPPR